MSNVVEFPKTGVSCDAESADGVCQEADGCPTERAVLQRFWRAHQAMLAGWKLVPLEPTDAMVIAGVHCEQEEHTGRYSSMEAAYRAILAAAPDYPCK
jgi:hypothetical protein